MRNKIEWGKEDEHKEKLSIFVLVLLLVPMLLLVLSTQHFLTDRSRRMNATIYRLR